VAKTNMFKNVITNIIIQYPKALKNSGYKYRAFHNVLHDYKHL